MQSDSHPDDSAYVRILLCFAYAGLAVIIVNGIADVFGYDNYTITQAGLALWIGATILYWIRKGIQHFSQLR